MPIRLFGFQVGRKRKTLKSRLSFVPPANADGAVVLEQGGFQGTFLDQDGTIRSETELITRYRDMSIQPEVDNAIRHIVNEALVVEENQPGVSLVTDKLNYSEETKDKIRQEFDTVLNLLNFNNEGQDIFRTWYVDGRLYYHIIINVKDPREGIQELRPIDPRKIHKVITQEKQITAGNVELITDLQDYYAFNDLANDYTSAQGGVLIAPDAIAYAHSGIVDHNSGSILGHLHKAIKPINQLRMVEDATVIYRMSRAPERRAFYIDVGNLPKTKAEQYLRDIMNQYRNKIVYDAQTGEIRDDKKFMSMMEDYWLPRREGNRGTEIQTLQGGANLSELADVEYFQNKLYQALNVPVTRLKPETAFSIGRVAEITRDEVAFGKFIFSLRNRFTHLFDILLSRQLMLKGIIGEEDWEYMRQNIFYSFLKDTFFAEMKNLEIMQTRFNFARDLGVSEFVGTVISNEWLRTEILQQTEEDIKTLDAQIKKEKAQGEGTAPDQQDAAENNLGDENDTGGEDDGAGEAGGEDTGGEEQAPEETEEGPDDEQIKAAAKKAGVDPKEIYKKVNAYMNKQGNEEPETEEEPEEDDQIRAAAKKAGVDPKEIYKKVNAYMNKQGNEEAPEEEEPEGGDEDTKIKAAAKKAEVDPDVIYKKVDALLKKQNEEGEEEEENPEEEADIKEMTKHIRGGLQKLWE